VLLHPIDLVAHHSDTEAGHVLDVPQAAQHAEFDVRHLMKTVICSPQLLPICLRILSYVLSISHSFITFFSKFWRDFRYKFVNVVSNDVEAF
jgi:hypothetical protein